MPFLSKSTAHRERIAGRQLDNISATDEIATNSIGHSPPTKESATELPGILLSLFLFLGVLAFLAAPLLFWVYWV